MVVDVMSRSKFEQYAFEKHNKTSIVISIASYGESEVFAVCNEANRILAIKQVFFNDTDDRNPIYGGIDTNTAIEIAHFLRTNYSNTVDKIIVHCGAGQSRSAGVAAAILKYYTGDDSKIFNNPRYTPNMLCYRRILEALMIG